MLPLAKARSSPNRGRYLFHNRALRFALGSIDALLDALHPPLRAPLDINPSKILVCNQAHIGDVILASSILPVLKAAFPESSVGFLAHPGSINVLAGNPHVEWVHTFEHWKLNRRRFPVWKKLAQYWTARSRALREIRAIGYDLAIDLYPYFPNSIPLIRAARIPLRLGWTSGGFAGLLTHAVDWKDGPEHVVEWYKNLLAIMPPCSAHIEAARPELYSSDDIRCEWKEAAATRRIPKNYIAFHIGAGAAHKRWPEESWKELARLCIDSGIPIVLLGHGADEEGTCARLAELSPHMFDLSGKLSWRTMAEAIGNARLLVGLDSACGHIAAARDVPAVCMYTGITRTCVWRPYHSKARVLVHSTPCSPCYISNGCSEMECVRLTKPHTVFREIVELLGIQVPQAERSETPHGP